MPRKRNPDRPRQILDAARELFGTRGYHDTQIADIATALGIGHGTVYRYFDNKRDIYEQLLDEIVHQYVAAHAGTDPEGATTLEEYEAQLRHIGTVAATIFVDSPASMYIVLQAESLDPEMNARYRRAMQAFAAVSGLRVANGVRRGFLRTDLDIEATAQLMLAATFEAIRRAVEAPDDPAHRERYLDAAVHLIVRGIAAP
jgi:AcrR family transcriptional regulator